MENGLCKNCGAIGESCCETAQARLLDANALSRVVARQAVTITRLERERDDARSALSEAKK